MISLFAVVCGLIAWVFVRYILTSFYIIDQNQRAVLTNFGRAQRLGGTTTLELPIAESLGNEEKTATRIPRCGSCSPVSIGNGHGNKSIGSRSPPEP